MRLFATLFALWPVIGVQATPLDEWLTWRLEADAREIEDQLGIETGDEITLQRIALRSAAPAGQGEEACVVARVLPPSTRVGLSLSGWGGRRPGTSLSMTLTLRGPRRRLFPCPPGPPPAVAATAPARAPTGHEQLDHTLWQLARAQQAALSSTTDERVAAREGRP